MAILAIRGGVGKRVAYSRQPGALVRPPHMRRDAHATFLCHGHGRWCRSHRTCSEQPGSLILPPLTGKMPMLYTMLVHALGLQINPWTFQPDTEYWVLKPDRRFVAPALDGPRPARALDESERIARREETWFYHGDL